MSIFDRTSIFCKESGLKRRLPYELIVFGGHGFFSFVPATLTPLANVDTNTTIIEDFDDYFYDDDVSSPEIDEIVNEVIVASEVLFLNLQDHVSGYYDSNPSSEFGYPR